MTRVEKLLPQIVEKIKPDEKKNVDAHPGHLQTQQGHDPFTQNKSTFCCREKRVYILISLLVLKMHFLGGTHGILRTKLCVKYHIVTVSPSIPFLKYKY